MPQALPFPRLSAGMAWHDGMMAQEESGYRGFYHHLLRPGTHYLPFWKERPEEVRQDRPQMAPCPALPAGQGGLQAAR